MDKKTFGDSLVIGLALFCMFFGAGNLIFPPFLGSIVGDDFSGALVGFLLTGVGLPFFSILACARLGGSYELMGAKIGPLFTMVTMLILSLLLGPLAAIPRTAATAYELGVRSLLPGASHWMTSALYFSVVLFFVLKPTKILDMIGKVLTPVLLATLLGMVGAGIFFPIGELAPTGVDYAFGLALREGYNTMDALGGVIMATIPLAALKAKGYTEKATTTRILVQAGIISSVGLGIVYGGLMFLGAQASGLGLGSLSRIDLLLEIAGRILGQPGIVALSVITILACLSTAVVLMIICAEYFTKLFKGRVPYEVMAIILTFISGGISLLDVDQIVGMVSPLLEVIYPIIIIQIAAVLLKPLFRDDRVLKVTVYATLAASMAMIGARLLGLDGIEAFFLELPLAQFGFAWLSPAVLAYVSSRVFFGFALDGKRVKSYR